MQWAEQMTFTRVWLRWLITNFHKVARLVWRADTAHKICGGITTLATFRTSQTIQVKGMKCSGWHFMQSKPITKCYAEGRSECNSGSRCFLGRWAHWFKKCMAAVKRERCAWVTVQQMCHVVLLVFMWPAFCNDASPKGEGGAKGILLLQPLPPVCKSSSFLHLPVFLVLPHLPLPSPWFPCSLPFNHSPVARASFH